jgi:hypothetical protein
VTVLWSIPSEFYLRLLLHVVFLVIMVRFLYYPSYRKRDYVFNLSSEFPRLKESIS